MLLNTEMGTMYVHDILILITAQVKQKQKAYIGTVLKHFHTCLTGFTIRNQNWVSSFFSDFQCTKGTESGLKLNEDPTSPTWLFIQQMHSLKSGVFKCRPESSHCCSAVSNIHSTSIQGGKNEVKDLKNVILLLSFTTGN